MTKFLRICVIASAAVLLGGVAQARDLKIGVVNMQRAVSETKEGQAAEKRLAKMKDKLQAELDRKMKELSAKQAELAKAWKILKDKERGKRQAEFRKEYEALMKRAADAERTLMQRKTREMLNITKRLSKVIEKLAKRSKYDYIFANAAVLWAPRHVDLTNEVIREFDNK